MKNKLWIVIAVLFTLIITGSVILYPKLAEKYSNNENLTISFTEESKNEPVKQADSFAVYDFEMNTVNLSDFFGKPIVVNFWASWCVPCKSELPAFENMYNKYKDEVVFLMVNITDGYSDTVQSIKNFTNQNGYTFPVYLDLESDATKTYSIYSIPETIFINTDGTLNSKQLGAISEKTLENNIKNILGG